MQSVLNDAWQSLLRLLPANPILVRVVHSGSRRTRHDYIRGGFLMTLFVITVIMIMSAQTDSLAEASRTSAQTFQITAYVQLLMMCFIAPIFAAGAITQERDNETYNILLTTPLTNSQIVIGSLFSRLYFIFVLLIASLPIYSLTLLYGGVTLRQVLLSGLISACTALMFGAFAISVAVIGVGTRRTIFTFYMLIAIYLLSVYALSNFTVEPTAPVPAAGAPPMSYLAAFHPFLALFAVLGQTPPPEYIDVQHYPWPWPSLLAYPYQSFCWLTVISSLIALTVCIQYVRHREYEGEETSLSRIMALVQPGRRANNQSRPPKPVWDNPVAWREARTRASLGGTGLLRGLLIGGGAAACCALLYMLFFIDGRPNQPGFDIQIQEVRAGLEALIMIELALILLMAANTSASALTREYESKSLDTLITSPLTPRYIIGGKIQGLISFAVPLVIVPVVTLAVFGAIGLVRDDYAVVPPEACLLLALVLSAFAALACVFGMWISLQNTRTVSAVMKCIASLVIGHGILYGCVSNMFGNALGPYVAQLSPFSAVTAVIDPADLADLSQTGAVTDIDILRVRVILVIAAAAIALMTAAVIWSLYSSMAKTFDQIIRTKISEAG